MRFENPANGYVEETTAAPLWCLLFGGIYFAVKGVWGHAIVALVLATLTAGISWLIYPFFATEIIRTHYLRRGWIEIMPPQRVPIASDAQKGSGNAGRNLVFGLLGAVLLIAAVSVWHTGIHGSANRDANGVPECNKDGPPANLCFLKFGQVDLQLAKKNNKLNRAVLRSDDMKRDATDFALAAGFLMMTINPHSTAGQRGRLLKALIVSNKRRKPAEWSGYEWRFDKPKEGGVRLVANRN